MLTDLYSPTPFETDFPLENDKMNIIVAYDVKFS